MRSRTRERRCRERSTSTPPLDASAVVPEGLQPGIYGNLAKVYLPPGAEVVAIRGTTGPPRLLSTDAEVVAGGLVVVPGGTTVTILISYRPAEAPRVLELWKQGGMEHDTYRVLRNVDGQQESLSQGAFTSDVRVTLE